MFWNKSEFNCLNIDVKVGHIFTSRHIIYPFEIFSIMRRKSVKMLLLEKNDLNQLSESPVEGDLEFVLGW